MEERQQEQRQRPTSPLFADNAELKKNKRTSGQKIIMFVMLVVVAVMTFVFMADNSERTVEREKNSRNARLTDASRLTNDLLEASRKPPVIPPRPTEKAVEEKPPEKKSQVIVVQQSQAPKKKTRKITDYEKESGRKWRDFRTNSLESKSSIDSFGNLRSEAPQPTQNSSSSGQFAARGGAGNLNAADIQAMAALEATKSPQQRKLDFLTQGGGGRTPQDYSSNIRRPQLAPMELKAGTVIPGLLLTGINSDLPGMVIGQVSENVYDSATGNWLLIPQGSRLIGVYDSNIAQGQNRVAVVWNRIIYPDGSSLNIAGTPGADLAGYSGIKGKVDNHYGQLLVAALFTSFFTAAVDIASNRSNDNSNNNNNNRKSAKDVLVETTATTIANIGSRLAERALDIQPTIIVKPGTRHNVIIQQDVIFPEPWREPVTAVAGF